MSNEHTTAAEARVKNELQEAWDSCDHNARFEAWAALYYARFGRLAPGKSDMLRDSCSDENRALCDAWHKSRLAAHDAIMRVVALESYIEELERKIEELRP